MGQRGCSNDRRILDAHPMMNFVALLQSAQDRDRVLHVRFADEDDLEASLQGGVLLDVLAILIERGGADGTQLSAR